jgi:hypothetical protein
MKKYIPTAVILLLWIGLSTGLAVWDKTLPADSTIFRSADDAIRANNTAIEDAINLQHVFATGVSPQSGAHRPGKASILAYESTATIDAAILGGSPYAHDGLLFDTTLGQFFTMNSDNTAKVAMVLGSAAINLIDEDDMATDSATRPPSQQSVKAFVTSGTVTMTNKTLTSPTLTTPVLTSPTINTAVSGSAIDATTTLGTSDTLLPTQNAVKTYVDTQVATKSFGTMTSLNTLGAALVQATVANHKANYYKAECDGFLIVSGGSGVQYYAGISASSAAINELVRNGDTTGGSVIVPVPKDYYWSVWADGDTAITTITWMPLGTGGCVKQP